MKKRVRDKRGFTLIELLVVIALMLSILGIAIVSFVGISNKNKAISQLSDIEKLKAENRLLKAQTQQQQMEIDFLKKLDEIERR